MKFAIASCVLFAVTTTASWAGPLSPPAGPITPTYKTLQQVEPRTAIESLASSATAMYVIDRPGSYYLTGNVTGVTGKCAISVENATGVTIDLGGFTLRGVAGARSAIEVANTSRSVAVRHGFLLDWPMGGLAGNGRDGVVEDIEVRGSPSGFGISVGPGALLRDCRSIGNQLGFTVSGPSTFESCRADENMTSGYILSAEANVRDCTAAGNHDTGFFLINSGRLTNCIARGNIQFGVSATRGVDIVDCTIIDAPHTGVYIGNSCTLTRSTVRCTAILGTTAVLADTGCRIENNRIDTCEIGVRVMGRSNLVARNFISNLDSIAMGIQAAPFNLIGPVTTSADATSPLANIVF